MRRDELFPRRSADNDAQVQGLTAEFVRGVNLKAETYDNTTCRSLTTLREFIPNYDLLKEKGLFLCGYMKCGTTLLLELLDNHPELVVLPGDGWFMGRRYLDCEDAAVHYKRQFRDHWLARIINPTGQAPFWMFGKNTSSYLDFVNDYDTWHELLSDPRRAHMIATVLAYCSANPNRPAVPKMWVEKTPGNEFETERILSFFPEAKFLHIVRDPRENYASLKKLYKTRNWDWKLYSIAQKIGKSCASAIDNQNKFGKDRYLVLQYEKLTEDPRKALEKIVDFLDISWDEKLLIPTVNGGSAQANTMYGDRKITGEVRRATKDKWKSVLSPPEKRAILSIQKEAKKAGYRWNVASKDIFIHMIESLYFRIMSVKEQL